jgi:hypothetical protein
MPKRGRTRKKSRTHQADAENVAGTLGNEDLKVPKSLVVRKILHFGVFCDFSLDAHR